MINRNVRVNVNGVPQGEIYTTGTGQAMTTHLPTACKGRYCAIHRPWPGSWSQWPTHWHSASAKMFRICEHQVPHPVAEDYLRMNGYSLQHDCDGCPCRPDPRDVLKIIRQEWIIDGEVVDNIRELGP